MYRVRVPMLKELSEDALWLTVRIQIFFEVNLCGMGGFYRLLIWGLNPVEV